MPPIETPFPAALVGTVLTTQATPASFSLSGMQNSGDSHALLTFGVLVAGLTFIGWRIARSVKRRDAPRTPPAG